MCINVVCINIIYFLCFVDGEWFDEFFDEEKFFRVGF